DLARVVAHVLDHVPDHVGPVDLRALDQPLLRERALGKAADHSLALLYDGAQAAQELLLTGAAHRRELGRPVTLVRGAAEGGQDPLRQVALQVQQQVADAVRGGVRLPPDLLFREQRDARLDLVLELAEEGGRDFEISLSHAMILGNSFQNELVQGMLEVSSSFMKLASGAVGLAIALAAVPARAESPDQRSWDPKAAAAY